MCYGTEFCRSNQYGVPKKIEDAEVPPFWMWAFQTPRNMRVTMTNPPFRLAASVSWCWWREKERAVEVVPGI